MKFIGLLSLLILCVVYFDSVSAWDQEEFEIFDLVEEINQNFYSVLKVEQVIYVQHCPFAKYFKVNNAN